MIIAEKLKFEALAVELANELFTSAGHKPIEEVRHAADADVIPRIVWRVCKGCESIGIRNPDQQEAYASAAVKAFDKRLARLMATTVGHG